MGGCLLARGAVAVLAAVYAPLSATAAPAPAAPACGRFAVQGLLPGMTDDQVREIMGGGGSLSQVLDPGSGEISVRSYGPLASSANIVFDRKIGRGGDARVVRVRVGFVSSRENLEALASRLGPPTTGPDGLAPGLPGGVVVWADRGCDLVLSAYRRQESWWSGDVGTFLQLERFEDARKNGSPAADAIRAMAASEPPALELEITSKPPAPSPAPEASADAPADDLIPARRVHYVAPLYPQTARWRKTSGRVRLSILVREDGSVGDVRILEAAPIGNGFEQAAVDAAKRWRYDPATRGGRPVASEQVIVLDFR